MNFKKIDFFQPYILIVAILAFLSSGSSDILAVSINNVYNVLLALFAFIGLKVLYFIISRAKGSMFTIVVIVASFALFTTTALTLVSLFGVYYSLFAVNSIDKFSH